MYIYIYVTCIKNCAVCCRLDPRFRPPPKSLEDDVFDPSESPVPWQWQCRGVQHVTVELGIVTGMMSPSWNDVTIMDFNDVTIMDLQI